MNHDAHEVALIPGAEGAELRVVLAPAHGPDAVREALALGFSSALSFEAGVACDDEGRWLLLTRWLDELPDAPALETARAALLEQRAAWRALLPDTAARVGANARARSSQELRQQQRLRSLFAGATGRERS